MIHWERKKKKSLPVWHVSISVYANTVACALTATSLYTKPPF